MKMLSDMNIQKAIDTETITKAIEEIELLKKSLEALFYISPSSEDAKTYLNMSIEELNRHCEQTLIF